MTIDARAFLIACVLSANAQVSVAQPNSPADQVEAGSCATDTSRPTNVAGRVDRNNEELGKTNELLNPSIGFNLSGVVDWTTQQPFIDVMKTSRSWVGHIKGQWGGWGHEELDAGGYLDEDGWVKAFPPELDAVEALILTDLPAEFQSSAGRYRVTYEGSGEIGVTSHLNYWPGADGEIWFDFEPGLGLFGVKIFQTDPEHTGDYIRNIAVVKEENIPDFESGELFNPMWLESIRDARVVRFMDWMMTNNSTQSKWQDRPHPSDYTYTRQGVPLEVMVNLANRIGSDPWFNMPHLATDLYIRCFAEAVHGLLRPDLKAHVELSNEVWNFAFGQADWASQSGKARWGKDDTWMQYYTFRSIEMARIWDEVYGEDAKQRLVKVITTQTGWPGLEEQIFSAPLWKSESPTENVDVAHYFDAYAVTGYFGYGLGDSKADKVKEWIAESTERATADSAQLIGTEQANFIEQHRFDLAIDKAAQEIRDGSLTGEKGGTVADYLESLLPYHSNIAKTSGLDLIMYEGGTHIVGMGPVGDDAEMNDFFAALNYSPQMGEIYLELMEGWKKGGGTLFNAYVDVAGSGSHGNWGALRFLGDENPRWDALVQFNTDNAGWWEERGQNSFVGN